MCIHGKYVSVIYISKICAKDKDSTVTFGETAEMLHLCNSLIMSANHVTLYPRYSLFAAHCV